MDDNALWGVASAFQVDIIVVRARNCALHNVNQLDLTNDQTCFWIWTKWCGPGGSLVHNLHDAQPTPDDYARRTQRWKKAVFLLNVGDNHFIAVQPASGWRS